MRLMASSDSWFQPWNVLNRESSHVVPKLLTHKYWDDNSALYKTSKCVAVCYKVVEINTTTDINARQMHRLTRWGIGRGTVAILVSSLTETARSAGLMWTPLLLSFFKLQDLLLCQINIFYWLSISSIGCKKIVKRFLQNFYGKIISNQECKLILRFIRIHEVYYL